MALSSIYQTAVQAAIDASAVVMQHYEQGIHPSVKVDGTPVTEADLASSKLIHARLEQTGIPVVGEEIRNRGFAERQHWKESWCVDPLDGTKEFIKRNGEFAVNIALIREHAPIFGVIAWPAEEKLLFGGKEPGAFFCSFRDFANPEAWQRLQPRKQVGNPLMMISSRTHYSGNLLLLVNSLEERFGKIGFLQKGSALKFFDLALGNADIYPRFAPTMEWDIAAGQAILEALGGSVVHAESGLPLTYNKPDLLNPHFVARTQALLLHPEKTGE